MNQLRSKKTIAMQLIAVFSFLAIGTIAFASSGGEGHSAVVAKHWTATDWERVMNFAVLAIALFFVARKPVADALNNRITTIKNQLEELEAKKEKAASTLADYERKIATLDSEMKQILAQYEEQGEAAKKRILEKAASSAEKMKEQAKRNIENEFKNAKQQLQAEMMSEALQKAEELVKKSISSEDQDRLIDEYLKKVVA
jgi:F-type H+-transporting ATPase subunit b